MEVQGAKLFSTLSHLGSTDGSMGRSRDSSGKEIMALKIKITIHYIKVIISPVILILPSLASSSKRGSS